MAASDAAFPKADPRLKPLRWPLRLTRAGMIAEQLLRALWPAASVLMLALAANIGVSTMVGSFRLAFTDWLDNRLVAEL